MNDLYTTRAAGAAVTHHQHSASQSSGSDTQVHARFQTMHMTSLRARGRARGGAREVSYHLAARAGAGFGSLELGAGNLSQSAKVRAAAWASVAAAEQQEHSLLCKVNIARASMST